AVAAGQREEFEKTLTGALLRGEPFINIDNVNKQTLRSNVLSSALTERPALLRPMRTSQLSAANAASFIAINGNALRIAMDMVRRVIVVELDAGVEHPEQRKFKPGFATSIKQRRVELLSALLTIWRWGRQNAATLTTGRAMASYETFSLWVRDPL